MQPSDERRLLVEQVHAFAQEELLPVASEMDRSESFPTHLWPKLAKMGLLGIGIDEAYGGSGGTLMDAVLVGEELAWACGAVALSMGAHANLCAWNLFRNGNEAQRTQYLPSLCAGTTIGALGLTEPDQGSDAVGMKTVAVADGDDWLLSGQKMLITNAPIADLFIIYAKTTPDAGPMGITAFIVERDFPGLTCSPPIDKMGLRGSPTGGIFLDQCRVPKENVLGHENHGIQVLMRGLDVERMIFASLPLGVMRRALELSLTYAKERHQFGRPIGKFQLIQAKLADMSTLYRAARALVHETTQTFVEEEAQLEGGKGSPLHLLSAQALLFAAEAGETAVDHAVQVHGGWGFTSEYEVSRLYRDIRLGTLGAGTSEIRRLIIGRELMGM